jgi:AraC-like DNA-binding protein
VVYAHRVYTLRPPHASLAHFIEHYWFVEPDGARPLDLQVAVFVDARADLIFNFGAPYRRQVIGGRAARCARSNVDAQRVVPIRIVQRGRVHVVGVRFRLGGLGPFAAAPLAPWTGRTPAPERVLGSAVGDLERTLTALRNADAQAKALDAFFLRQLDTAPPWPTFASALGALSESDGARTIAEVAEAVGISSRHLSRLFARYLGIAPKTVGRILRFQRALRALMRDPGCTLAAVASDAGYFDQAHFIREFRTFSGGVPRGYRGYYPPQGPNDFAPNVVSFVQDAPRRLR